jgi:hypothetical protein
MSAASGPASSHPPHLLCLKHLPEFGAIIKKPYGGSHLSESTAIRTEPRWGSAWLGTGIAQDEFAVSVTRLPLPHPRMHS